MGHSFAAKGQLTAQEVLDDAVEAPPAVGVTPGHSHRVEPRAIHESHERRAVGRVENPHPGEIFGRCRIGVQPVDETDTVHDPTLDEPALVDLGMQLE